MTATLDIVLQTNYADIVVDPAPFIGEIEVAVTAVGTAGTNATPITRYTSPAITLQYQFSTVYNHGLGGYPKRVGAYVECISADGGYAVGERVDVGTFFIRDGGYSYGSLFFSATQIGYAMQGYIQFATRTGTIFAVGDYNAWRLYLWAEIN